MLYDKYTGMTVFWAKWVREACQMTKLTWTNLLGPKTLSPHFILHTLLVSNFIGIVFARSLHYQFYSWYYFSIPYLLWSGTALPLPVKVAIWLGIEVAFNVYPATPASSLLLQVSHALVVYLSDTYLNLPSAIVTLRICMYIYVYIGLSRCPASGPAHTPHPQS